MEQDTELELQYNRLKNKSIELVLIMIALEKFCMSWELCYMRSGWLISQSWNVNKNRQY